MSFFVFKSMSTFIFTTHFCHEVPSPCGVCCFAIHINRVCLLGPRGCMWFIHTLLWYLKMQKYGRFAWGAHYIYFPYMLPYAHDVTAMHLCQARRIMQWWLWLPSSRLLSRPSMWSTSGKQTSWLDQSYLLTNPLTGQGRQMYYSAQWIGII